MFHLLKQLMGTGSREAAAPAGAIGIGIGEGGISIRDDSGSKSAHPPAPSTSAVVDDMIYGTASIPERAQSSAIAAERRRRRLVEPTRFVLEENLGEELSEQALLRDVVFAFQGIDGKYVRWSNRANAFMVDPRTGVLQAVRTLVGKLCEMGWLFRRVREFIRRTTSMDYSNGEHRGARARRPEPVLCVAGRAERLLLSSSPSSRRRSNSSRMRWELMKEMKARMG